MSQKSKLTQQLLSLDPEGLQRATQHPFLQRAARASLPQPLLVSWIAQDRLYASCCLTFMAQLLAKIDIPSSSDRTSTLNWRIADCLIDCLVNIRTELKLFEDTAAKHGWMNELGEATPGIETQTCKDLFDNAGLPSATLLKGMVTLWATEKCYLFAWTYAKGQIPDSQVAMGSGDVMQSVFIPNWSSKEFAQFVDVLGNLVDELAETATENDVAQVEAQWREILAAEEDFWPDVKD